MTEMTIKQDVLSADIWASFKALPKWVLVWVIAILMPVNMASFAFLSEPSGIKIASMVMLGMMLSMIPLIRYRGFSKLVSAGHIVPWTMLIFTLLFARPEAKGAYDIYLTVLLIINSISLVFDYTDAYRWLRGDRSVAGFNTEN